MIQFLTVNLLFACWSHLLNYIGTVLLYSQNPTRCFSCNQTVSWSLFVPFYGYACSCSQILLYYPTLLTLLGITMFNALYFSHSTFFIAAFLFCSCLLINIRTDAETSLLSRFTTVYPVPLFVAASYYNQLPIDFVDSLTGICLGYGFLWIIRWIFFCVTKKEGLGVGDLELLALIGAFLGPVGAWISILVGSILGTLYISIQRVITQRQIQQIPFGPFLSIGGFIYIIFQQSIINLLLYPY